MKICNISDTHNLLHLILDKMEDSDLLLCPGDFTKHGTKQEMGVFFETLKSIEHRFDKIIFCAGNHDFYVKDDPTDFSNMVHDLGDKFVYLEDSEYIYNGIKIYGFPWTPKYGNWVFMLERNSIEMEEKCLEIPSDTQILISHGAPFGILDRANTKINGLGCEVLRQRVDIINPKLMVFGHIHSGYGMQYNMHKDSIYVNASICPNLDSSMEKNNPIIINISI